MPLHPTQLSDYVAATFPVVRKNLLKDLSTKLQRFEFVNRYLKGSKTPTKGGQYLKEMFKVKNGESFRLTGLFDSRNVTIVPQLKEIRVDWAMVDATSGFDIREDDFQGDAATILRTSKVRQHGMYMDYFTGMEYAMWKKADGPGLDPAQIFGIPTWIVKGANTDFAFGGGNPAGFSAGVGGLSSSVYDTWANGSFIYSTVGNNDLFKKWSAAIDHCEWVLPYALDGESVQGPPEFVNYTTHPVLSAIQDFLTSANDNLKVDVGKFRGTIYFRSSPVLWVPALSNADSPARDTQHPIYGMAWNKFHWFFLKGWDMKVTGPEKMPHQTHSRTMQLDAIGNFICMNRRETFVGHTTTFAQ